MIYDNKSKPKVNAPIIIQFGGQTSVGKYFEKGIFNSKKCPLVQISYNGAFVPWSSVEHWTYVNYVFNSVTNNCGPVRKRKLRNSSKIKMHSKG